MESIDFSKFQIQSLSKAQLVELISIIPIDLTCSFLGIDDLRVIVRKFRLFQAKQKDIKRQQEQEAAVQSKHGEDTSQNLERVEADDAENESVTSGSTETSAELEFNMADPMFTMEFNKNKQTWEEYVDRMDLYFIAKEIKDKKRQVALFLTMCGVDTYRLINQLCSPAKPGSKTLDELTKLVSEHYCPKRNQKMERCIFNKAEQQQNESVSEFVARLKQLSIHCGFTDLDDALCDRLVCGISDHDTKVALFSQADLNFTRAVEIATTRETAVKNAVKTQKQPDHASVQHVGSQQRGRGRSSYNNNSGRYSNPNADANNKRGKICYCCGMRDSHTTKDCKFRDKAECDFCHKKNHLEKACIKKHGKDFLFQTDQKSSKKQGKKVHHVQNDSESEDEQGSSNAGIKAISYSQDSSSDRDFYPIISEQISSKMATCGKIVANPLMVQVLISDQVVEMEVDTGTYVTAMSEYDWKRMLPDRELDRCDFLLTSYGGIPLQPIGKLKAQKVNFNKKEKHLDIYVVKGKGPILIGRQWLKAFDLWPIKLLPDEPDGKILNVSSHDLKGKMLGKFPALFSNTQGCYTGRKIQLVFKEGAKPIQLKPHHAPFALTGKISKEIQRLVALGNLEPVSCSKWATPIIPVLKKNGDVRICGNFKLTVNPQLVIKRHPIPLKEKIFNTLRVGRRWSQIDLKHAFMQFELDDASKEALTIITHEGLHRYTKLGEGVASSPAECQDILEDILKGLKHTEIYIDNIYCTGRTDDEHVEILTEIFSRLDNAGLRVNLEKCDFFRPEIEVLGYLIDEEGLKPSQSKIRAINDAPVPQNVKELEAFLGLVNFYERFLVDRADYVWPLYELCKSKKWIWTDGCQKGFEWVKSQITSDRVLTLFNPETPLVLACDASDRGLSAILSHRFEDGSERPIAFASKIIPKNERHRAIIDKEAGAIIFGFKKFYQYIYGNHIILKTDHEPLKFIFGNKNISTMLHSRLQRWAYFLSGYTYTIEVVKSKANGNCDALSRLPSADKTKVFDAEYTNVNYIEDGCPITDFQTVASATSHDKTLKKIISYVQNEWPKTDGMSGVEKNFHGKRFELDIEQGCLYWGYRLVIPESLQNKMLQELHSSHLGVAKMKQMARNYVWWPYLDAKIEELANTCKICLESRASPPKTALTPWQWPSKPWSRIHLDFMGPFHGCMFLVIVDAHTKWPEVINMKKDTTATKLIRTLDEIFSRFGLPTHVVSDNGPQLTSVELRAYLKQYRIKHTFSAPYYPATNGAAENLVRTVKSNVDKMIRDGHSLEFSVNRFLSDYRNTAHCTTNQSPAQLMFKRELRTRFDLLKSDPRNTVEAHQYDQHRFKRGDRKIAFESGDVVYAKDFRRDTTKNAKATIVEKLSPVMYNIQFEDGYVTKRHVNQIVRAQLSSDVRRGESIDSDSTVNDAMLNSERSEPKKRISGKSSSDSAKVVKDDKVKRNTRQRISDDAPRRSARLASKREPSN